MIVAKYLRIFCFIFRCVAWSWGLDDNEAKRLMTREILTVWHGEFRHERRFSTDHRYVRLWVQMVRLHCGHP